MTNEQAKSELMQIYMSLSEEKKKALDVAFKAMEQADNIPEMYYPQVDGITPTVVAQADGEYILKKDVMCCIGQTSVHSELARKLRKLPSVAIPPDHDGCKDCKYVNRSTTEEPCVVCKQNYKDKWESRPHWKKISPADIYECSECGQNVMTQDIDAYNFCHGCGCPMVIER